MNLFLDTNVYLSFYKLSDADLQQLTQLVDAVESGGVSLLVSDQVHDEFYRGREKTIADSLRPVEVEKFGREFPAPFRNYPGFEELSKTLDAYGKQRSALLKEVRQAALEKRLHADGLIGDLFDQANEIRMTPDVLAAAQQRMDLGNPPGKKGSYGDAVNWESLLGAIPDGEDLFLVTADTDYLSPLDPGGISDFLHDEWSRRKHGNVTLYSTLRAFLASHYPAIKLTIDPEKDLAISELINSSQFRQTHAAIAALTQYEFSPQEVERLIKAANSNTQIRWLLNDDDVREFYDPLVQKYASSIDAEQLKELIDNIVQAGGVPPVLSPISEDT